MFVKCQDRSFINLKQVSRIHVRKHTDYESLSPNDNFIDHNLEILLDVGFKETEKGSNRFSRCYFEVIAEIFHMPENLYSDPLIMFKSTKDICDHVLDALFFNFEQQTPCLDLTRILGIDNSKGISKDYQLKYVNDDLPF